MRSFRRSIVKQGSAKRQRSHPLKRHRFAMRIDLMDIQPPIWRRIETNSDLPLDMFHQVIQVVFDWKDSHLHEFTPIGPGRRPIGEPILMPYMIGEGEDGIAEETVRVGDVLSKPQDTLMYTYDFGDSWEHRIRLEEVGDVDPGLPIVTCTGGKRAAPPEDCGGVWGYQFMIDAGPDPKHPDHEEAAERISWIFGEDETFDPELFDRDRVNRSLAELDTIGFQR